MPRFSLESEVSESRVARAEMPPSPTAPEAGTHLEPSPRPKVVNSRRLTGAAELVGAF